METINPCKVCGTNPTAIFTAQGEFAPLRWVCLKCNPLPTYYSTAREAIDKWNQLNPPTESQSAGEKMTDARYAQLMSDDSAQLTQKELSKGWHFCLEFDGLLRQPMDESDVLNLKGEGFKCSCLEQKGGDDKCPTNINPSQVSNAPNDAGLVRARTLDVRFAAIFNTLLELHVTYKKDGNRHHDFCEAVTRYILSREQSSLSELASLREAVRVKDEALKAVIDANPGLPVTDA